MTSTNSRAMRGIESGDIWQAARRHRLYYRSDMELEALITRHHCGHAYIDRITAEAARHVRNLRRTLAAGDTL
jgi:hypothetical protein